MKRTESNKNKKPWPTKDAMSQIYEEHLWGGKDNDFYSGSGSHETGLVEPYVSMVRSFLSSFKDSLSVVDLGCGDFNVGQHFVPFTRKYEAVDIVPTLIERNRNKFSAKQLYFHCLDIAEDEWPAGDCVILRNVLQHLSNREIQRIVNKLNNFDFLILTEHVPEGDFIPNLDIISGQGIRLKKKSGVDLTAPPFNFSPEKQELWLSLKDPVWPGNIVTTFYRI